MTNKMPTLDEATQFFKRKGFEVENNNALPQSMFIKNILS